MNPELERLFCERCPLGDARVGRDPIMAAITAQLDLAVDERDMVAANQALDQLGGPASATLAERLDRLQAGKIDVRLDLSKVRFIDSTGIRVLVTTAYHARDDSGWKFEVEPALDPVVRHTLRVANVEHFILGEHHRRAR